jgi:hypothetical protein
MKRSIYPALVLLMATLGGCEDEPERLDLSLQVAGTAGRATIQYESGAGIRVLEDQNLPAIINISAEPGEAVRVYASTPGQTATLWILILEEGEIVASSTGCLCNGNYVSAEAGGVAGRW